MRKIAVLALVAAAGVAALEAQALKVDPALTPYQRVSGVSGSLSSVGSDTMNNMLTLWAETFPHERIPVLAADASVAEAYASSYPTLYLLDDSMRIVAMQGAGDTPYDVLDAAAAR